MQGTLTYTGGNVDPSVNYSLTLQKEKKVASTLTYTGTDYEGGPIITGNPDDIFNGNQQGGSVVINETRDDYYLRYNISTELTLAATQQQSLENLNVNDVKTDYAPGEAPRATGTIPAADADKYEIADSLVQVVCYTCAALVYEILGQPEQAAAMLRSIVK